MPLLVFFFLRINKKRFTLTVKPSRIRIPCQMSGHIQHKQINPEHVKYLACKDTCHFLNQTRDLTRRLVTVTTAPNASSKSFNNTYASNFALLIVIFTWLKDFFEYS